MGKMKIKGQALIIPDCHIPFEDKRAYNLMLKVCRDLKITEVVLLGDYADFYDISRHGKTPGVEAIFYEEVEAVNERLDELDREFPKAKKVYIEGNHEYRLARYLTSHAEALEGVVNVPALLKLKYRKNWKWVPYRPNQLYRIGGSDLYARHEPLSGSTHAAHGSVVKAGCSLVFGHIHRIQESQVVMADGAIHRGMSVGWLGDADHPVMSYVPSFHQWSHGFGIATILSNGNFFHNTVHIIDYRCVVNGKLYQG